MVDIPTSGNAGGSYYGRGARGTSRFLVDEERGVLVGATITGSEVADFLHAATIAIVGEVPVTRLRHATPAFPTGSEIWLKLVEELGLAEHERADQRPGQRERRAERERALEALRERLAGATRRPPARRCAASRPWPAARGRPSRPSGATC